METYAVTGGFYRFGGINTGQLVFVHSLGSSGDANALWLPSGRPCRVVGRLNHGKRVPDDEVPDEVWTALAAWRLMGSVP